MPAVLFAVVVEVLGRLRAQVCIDSNVNTCRQAAERFPQKHRAQVGTGASLPAKTCARTLLAAIPTRTDWVSPG